MRLRQRRTALRRGDRSPCRRFSLPAGGRLPKRHRRLFRECRGSIWQAVLPLLNKYARIPVCGLIAQYNGATDNDGTDRLPATMREIMSKSLTLRGFINYDFAEQYYADFLREVGAGIADGRIRYREHIVDGLENAPEAFIGMLGGHNFGKLIVRVAVGTA